MTKNNQESTMNVIQNKPKQTQFQYRSLPASGGTDACPPFVWRDGEDSKIKFNKYL